LLDFDIAVVVVVVVIIVDSWPSHSLSRGLGLGVTDGSRGHF
jgi:hypothetical protein